MTMTSDVSPSWQSPCTDISICAYMINFILLLSGLSKDIHYCVSLGMVAQADAYGSQWARHRILLAGSPARVTVISNLDLKVGSPCRENPPSINQQKQD